MTIASPTSDFQLILFDGAVKGLTAAFYSVLEVSIPLRKLSNDFVWTRGRLPRRKALAESHHVPGVEAMPGRLMQRSHCEAFSPMGKYRPEATPKSSSLGGIVI